SDSPTAPLAFSPPTIRILPSASVVAVWPARSTFRIGFATIWALDEEESAVPARRPRIATSLVSVAREGRRRDGRCVFRVLLTKISSWLPASLGRETAPPGLEP